METATRRIGVGHVERAKHRAHALRLEYLTVGWNLVEGVLAVWLALLAGSIALLAFGFESFVETASGAVIVWRFWAEARARDHEHVERIERRAQRLVAASLALLALYVAYEAVTSLVAGERPDASVGGIGLAAVSLLVMGFLARAKRRVARRLGSRAMEADAFQTTACMVLSAIVLAGVGLNFLLGWWWADPVAALFMVLPLGKEAKDAWEGKECCDAC